VDLTCVAGAGAQSSSNLLIYNSDGDFGAIIAYFLPGYCTRSSVSLDADAKNGGTMKKTDARLADRRAFLKRAGVAAATAPAAALLLSAQAKAQIAPNPSGGIIVDDVLDTSSQ
jgi:hypothetical protein